MYLENSQNPAVIAEQIQKLSNAITSIDSASAVDYDNTTSGLTADNVQGALDELGAGLAKIGLVDVTSMGIKLYTTSAQLLLYTNDTQTAYVKIIFFINTKKIELRTKAADGDETSVWTFT